MCHMSISHKQAIVPDNRFPLATVPRLSVANSLTVVLLPISNRGLLSTELKVLRY